MLLNCLNEKKLTLIVSLPKNDVEIARAAIKGGADVIKIHINVEHRASKTKFGSFDEELEQINKIVDICKDNNISYGIVAGGSDEISMDQIEKIIDKGFHFISLYDKHMNPLVLNKSILKMVAIDNEYKNEYVKAFDSLPIDILECSIMNPETYGKSLTVREILQYKSVRNNTNKPIVIPTQRNITAEQAIVLQEIGINAIMIGAIVTGKTAESIYQATMDFRKAIDSSN